jgi:hypothetical protein
MLLVSQRTASLSRTASTIGLIGLESVENHNHEQVHRDENDTERRVGLVDFVHASYWPVPRTR